MPLLLDTDTILTGLANGENKFKFPTVPQGTDNDACASVGVGTLRVNIAGTTVIRGEGSSHDELVGNLSRIEEAAMS